MRMVYNAPKQTVSQFQLKGRYARQYLSFAGKSSKDFLLYLSGPGVYDSPVADVESTSVPGRNGALSPRMQEQAGAGIRMLRSNTKPFSLMVCQLRQRRSSRGCYPRSGIRNCRILGVQSSITQIFSSVERVMLRFFFKVSRVLLSRPLLRSWYCEVCLRCMVSQRGAKSIC